MPSSAQPFLVIWNTSPADLQTQINAEQNEEQKTYLELLLAYRNLLPENNPHYKGTRLVSPMTDIFARLASLHSGTHNPELKAAIFNLQGLIYRGNGQYDEAKACLEWYAGDVNLSPLTKAILQIHILELFHDQELYEHENASYASIVNTIEIRDLNVEERKVVAALLSTVAYGYRKAGNPGASESLCLKALDLWPDNLVLANRLAIGLSKINSEEALTKAASIFQRFFDDSVANFRFVNPYYFADVNIKLAVIKKQRHLGDQHIQQAAICLNAASNAIDNNRTYQENYRVKAKSRIENLRCNLAFLSRDFEQAELHQTSAISLRNQVEETPQKNAKARQKYLDLNNTDDIDNPARFFRSLANIIPAVDAEEYKVSYSPRTV